MMSVSPDVIQSRDLLPRDASRDRLVPRESQRDVAECDKTQTLIAGLSISVQRPDRDLHPLQTKERFRRRHSVSTSLEEFTSQGFVPFLPEGLLKKGGAPPTPAAMSRAVPSSVLRRSSDVTGIYRASEGALGRESNGRESGLKEPVKKVSIGSQASSSGGDESPVLPRRKRFTDEDIDLLSYLYSNNFDPTKKAPSACTDKHGTEKQTTEKVTDIQGEGDNSQDSTQDTSTTRQSHERQGKKILERQTSRQEILAERLGVKDIGVVVEEEHVSRP